MFPVLFVLGISCAANAVAVSTVLTHRLAHSYWQAFVFYCIPVFNNDADIYLIRAKRGTNDGKMKATVDWTCCEIVRLY